MCVKVFLFVVVVVGTRSTEATTGCFDSNMTDICSNRTSDIPRMSSRDSTFRATNVTWEFCDLYDLQHKTWYKSESSMSTSCPPLYMCGNKFPIWLKDSNPEPHEGIVNRTSCKRYMDNCCDTTYRLAAVNCGDYMAYCLIDPPKACKERYCFDVSSKGESTLSASKSSTKTVTFSKQTTTTETITVTSGSNGPVSQQVSDSTEMSQSVLSSTVFKKTSTFPQGPKTSPVVDLRTTKETGVKEKEVDGNKELIIILMGSLGLSSAVIFALVIVIIRRRRNLKVNDENTKSAFAPTENKIEPLRVPGVEVLTPAKNQCPGDDMYKMMHYESLKVKNDGTEYDTLSPYQQDYDTIPGDKKEAMNTLGSLYDDEERYQTLP